MLAALAALLSIAHLHANKEGQPQYYGKTYDPDVCEGRSDICEVLLDVPAKCAGAVSFCPIVFCLHSFGGYNVGYIHMCGPLVHERGFIGVYPQGDPLGLSPPPVHIVPGWNDGQSVNVSRTLLRCKYDDYNCTLDPNDGVFFAKIIASMQAAGALGRFYSFGQSNGADFSQRLATNADRAHLPIVGIAAQSCQLDSKPPRSGAGPFNYNQPQEGHPPVAQLSIHGTYDGAVPYMGGSKFDSSLYSLFSEPASNSVWADHNGCTGPLTPTNVSSVYNSRTSLLYAASEENLTYTNGVATHWVWGGCPDVAPVEWYADLKAGHVGTVALGGKPTFEVVMDFFERVENAFLSR